MGGWDKGRHAIQHNDTYPNGTQNYKSELTDAMHNDTRAQCYKNIARNLRIFVIS
jgi:hypothetical protein